MDKIKKIVVVLLSLPLFLFVFNIQYIHAQDNSALIVQLEQEIQNLIKQIIALIQQSIQEKIKSNTGLQTNVNSQVQNQTQNSSSKANLTVNAVGVTAYVSINNGPQFAYVLPIMLNNGDTYFVTASVAGSNGTGNSTSKCSGVASSGGSYVCNIKINGY